MLNCQCAIAKKKMLLKYSDQTCFVADISIYIVFTVYTALVIVNYHTKCMSHHQERYSTYFCNVSY